MGKNRTDRHAPEEADAYLASQPAEMRETMEAVRATIREMVPEATERVSYGIPIFRLGADLVGLSISKAHCSLHVMSTSLMEAMAEELAAAGIQVSGATIHFAPEKPLPRELLERIVRERVRENARK